MNITPNILVVDDEAAIRKTISDVLSTRNYIVDLGTNGKEAVQMAFSKDYDVILLDIKMPVMDGMEALDRIKLIRPNTPIIMISALNTFPVAAEAKRKGAFDFIPKPAGLMEILTVVRKALDKNMASKKIDTMKKGKTNEAPKILGHSPIMIQLKKDIKKIAASDARVLILGPNGAGKELVAMNLHYQGPRRKSPYIPVNCAAIPTDLIESELFGHEKGAFTGASKARKGKFEQAHGGTIFLDEIGDMSLKAQAKVLRVLEDNLITKVGGDKATTVDVQVIAATNKDLKSMVERGLFRQDLYYRLEVIVINVPPLNERRDDIPMLVEHFTKLYCVKRNIPIRTISPDAIALLKQYDYQGNIRELKNIVERLMILGGQDVSKADVINYAINRKKSNNGIVRKWVHEVGGPNKAIEYIRTTFDTTLE